MRKYRARRSADCFRYILSVEEATSRDWPVRKSGKVSNTADSDGVLIHPELSQKPRAVTDPSGRAGKYRTRQTAMVFRYIRSVAEATSRDSGALQQMILWDWAMDRCRTVYKASDGAARGIDLHTGGMVKSIYSDNVRSRGR